MGQKRMVQDDVTSGLQSWVEVALGQVPVHFELPLQDPVPQGVFHLLGLGPTGPGRLLRDCDRHEGNAVTAMSSVLMEVFGRAQV